MSKNFWNLSSSAQLGAQVFRERGLFETVTCTWKSRDAGPRFVRLTPANWTRGKAFAVFARAEARPGHLVPATPIGGGVTGMHQQLTRGPTMNRLTIMGASIALLLAAFVLTPAEAYHKRHHQRHHYDYLIPPGPGSFRSQSVRPSRSAPARLFRAAGRRS